MKDVKELGAQAAVRDAGINPRDILEIGGKIPVNSRMIIDIIERGI